MVLDSPTDIKKQIKISAQTIFLDDYSNPSKSKYLFSYKIKIQNDSLEDIKLLNRYWLIIDSNSNKDEVKGSGVLGLQPLIKVGDCHEYISFCNLETHFGTMEGHYEFSSTKNEKFTVEIPRFYLSDNLNQFEKPHFKRGILVKHKKDNYVGVVTDYDMYFINDEEIYKKDKSKPDKNKPWYYILINQTNAISYVSQDHLEFSDHYEEIEHPLLDFFFDGFNGESYIRNEKTWEELKQT